jgi:hypothetical protein
MKRKLTLTILIVSILAAIPAISTQAKDNLIGNMDLYLILEQEENWKGTTALVTWEGTIELEGSPTPFYMRFFLIGTGIPRDNATGRASHFGEIWEIWSKNPTEQPVKKAVLILAGSDAGLTNVENDLTWKYRMNGIVEYANENWLDYLGRNVEMSGTIVWLGEPFAIGSTAPGTFQIN